MLRVVSSQIKSIKNCSLKMGSLISSNKPGIMSPEKRKFVEEAIAGDRVVIFSKSYCPYCSMAKKQFDAIPFKYTLFELNHRDEDDGDEIQDILADITGARTVPRVFIDGKCYGGGTDIQKMYKDGSLQKLLA